MRQHSGQKKLLLFLVMEPIVIKEANQLVVSFKFVDVQLLDVLKIVAEVTIPDSFLNPYKKSKSKVHSLEEKFVNPQMFSNTQPPH